MSVPFLSFEAVNKQIREEIFKSFQETFDGGWYILGNNVQKFETEYAAFNKVSDCIGLSNGLDALILALKVLDLKKDDEVIIPANTYIATLLAASYNGVKIRLVEPNKETYNIDPENIRKAVTKNTKVIIPVHLYGQACEMDAIMEIANANGIHVIEDNAQAHGAQYNGKLTGAFGSVNATSYYPGKNLGAFGDAGAITTNNKELGTKLRALRNYGSQKKYYNEFPGFNMRLDEVQAGFLSVKLKYLQQWTSQRQEIAALYSKKLKGIGDLVLPVTADKATHVYHLYVIRTKQRDGLQEFLKENGVGTMVHYPVPPHLQEAYKDLNLKEGSFPITEELAATCLSLPLWPGMKEEQVDEVVGTIKRFYEQGSNRL